MRQSYKLKQVPGHADGDVTTETVVYDLKYHDYGSANDDTRHTGIHHVSVTKDPEGDYPFFTVPKQDLIPL